MFVGAGLQFDVGPVGQIGPMGEPAGGEEEGPMIVHHIDIAAIPQ
jgi:hypothetical protein